MSNSHLLVTGGPIPTFRVGAFGCWRWHIAGSTLELRRMRRRSALVDIGGFVKDVGNLVGHKRRSENRVVLLDNLVRRSFLRLSWALLQIDKLTDQEFLLALEQCRRDAIAARERYNAQQPTFEEHEEDTKPDTVEAPVSDPTPTRVPAPMPVLRVRKPRAPVTVTVAAAEVVAELEAEPAFKAAPEQASKPELPRVNPKRKARKAGKAAAAERRAGVADDAPAPQGKAARTPRRSARRVRELAEA